MRELKFRAWHKNQKKLLPVWSIDSDARGWICAGEGRSGLNYTGEPSEFELMQYTGLKDKNGVEIYEGDLCEYNAGISPNSALVFKVVWDNSKARFGENQAMSVHDGSFLRASAKVEVIGNIYQSPELLTPTT